jgi:hypothetical protein
VKSYFETLKDEHRKQLQKDYDDFIKRGGVPYQAKNGESANNQKIFGNAFEELNEKRRKGAKARGPAITYSNKRKGSSND